MGGFYNKTLAESVITFADSQGITHPLDVVEYGGTARQTASVANNSSATILAAPPLGFSYRLQSYGIQSAEGLTAFSAWLVAISDGAGEIDANMEVFASAQTIIGVGIPLFGALASSAVTVFQLSSGTRTMFVNYDLVASPVMN